jgi:hypothetical protein
VLDLDEEVEDLMSSTVFILTQPLCKNITLFPEEIDIFVLINLELLEVLAIPDSFLVLLLIPLLPIFKPHLSPSYFLKLLH